MTALPKRLKDCNCGRARFDARKGWTADQCKTCWFKLNAGIVSPSRSPRQIIDRAKTPCRHRAAEPHRRVAACHKCPVYRCGLHGECANNLGGVRNCLDCSDYAPPAPTRHLCYHIMPCVGNDIWQLNVDRLRARLPLFDGVRSIAIVTGDGLADPAEVQARFAGDRIDSWTILPNDPSRREVATWDRLWEPLAGKKGVAFYGHAKGVTKANNPGVAVHRWADIMYRANLDHWPFIERLLEHHPVAGCWRKRGGFPDASWHYSGSFYWTRLAESLPSLDKITRDWWGVETWPGRCFPFEQAGVVFGEGRAPRLNLYHLRILRREEDGFRRWEDEHRER
jgi:hypothetical protein